MEDKKMSMEENEVEYNPHEIIKCCLCGAEMEAWQSNNPWPLVDDENSRCCHDCNEHQVLPARLKMMRKQNPAFIMIGDKFVSATDEKGIEKATDYYFSHFLTAREDRTDNVYRDILRNGFEKIGPDDHDSLILWAGYMMAVCDMRTEEDSHILSSVAQQLVDKT